MILARSARRVLACGRPDCDGQSHVVVTESVKTELKAPRSVPPPRTHAHAVARWCILPLLKTPVAPNHLTTLRLLTGLAAAGAFAVGDYFWICWGGVLFVISAVLDRADGELARLSGRISPGGHWYDLSCDMLVNMVVFVGIGFGLSDRVGGPKRGQSRLLWN